MAITPKPTDDQIARFIAKTQAMDPLELIRNNVVYMRMNLYRSELSERRWVEKLAEVRAAAPSPEQAAADVVAFQKTREGRDMIDDMVLNRTRAGVYAAAAAAEEALMRATRARAETETKARPAEPTAPAPTNARATRPVATARPAATAPTPTSNSLAEAFLADNPQYS